MNGFLHMKYLKGSVPLKATRPCRHGALQDGLWTTGGEMICFKTSDVSLKKILQNQMILTPEMQYLLALDCYSDKRSNLLTLLP